MYLTVKQHDAFRTLLMGFEIPYRKYIADIITKTYRTADAFDSSMRAKKAQLTPASPDHLKHILPIACAKNTLKAAYTKFQTATTSTAEIITEDIEIPMVGALNLATFALTECFGDLYALFGTYSSFCSLSDAYLYARNKLGHPGSRTLEDAHLVPVLSFVKDICVFLDDHCFLQKTKQELIDEVTALQQRKPANPIKIHNFTEMPYGDTRIVCRNTEINLIKDFVYGKPEDLRKQHSYCIYGYGGVGKTALVLEAIKQIVCDIQDNKTVNEYTPKYILFFSAKKRRIDLAPETGKFIEKQLYSHFETEDELKALIFSSLQVDSLRNFHDEGLVVIDNLETLPPEERRKVKAFVETQTPSTMQFILTSRNSEEYESNYKLAGFDLQNGKEFIETYCNENSLDLNLRENEKEELLSLAKGNTLVLVLCLRRLSKNLCSVGTLVSEFSMSNSWKSLKSTLQKTPSNAYEVIAEFMYKDTFEHIETLFSGNTELFYKVLKVFAVLQSSNTDINTVCLLTNDSYPNIEMVIDILCNYLILEKKDTQYSLNEFAEKYIVSKFLPDAETFNNLSQEISKRQREIKIALDKLKEDTKVNSSLAKIIADWHIISDIDKITAAKMYTLYGDVDRACHNGVKFKLEIELNSFLKDCEESEKLTAHPFVKFQKARVLQRIDRSGVLAETHVEEIKKSFNDAVYAIKAIEQYSGIQQTKSYASLMWLYGQYLSDMNDLSASMRYLEEGKHSFEEQDILDQEYYKCTTMLGTVYLKYYEQDKTTRLSYLRKARSISNFLFERRNKLGQARNHAFRLRDNLRQYGPF